MHMDCLNCLNEIEIVFRSVFYGVGMNLKPFDNVDLSGGASFWLVRLTMRLLLV